MAVSFKVLFKASEGSDRVGELYAQKSHFDICVVKCALFDFKCL